MVNKTGIATTLEAGDFSLFLKGGYTAPHRLSLSASSTASTFSLPASAGLNLWKRGSDGSITYLGADASATSARLFRFSKGVRYVLTLNYGSYSLTEGSKEPVTAPSAPPSSLVVTNRVYPTTTRSAFTAGIEESEFAKDLTVTMATVVSRRTSTGWTYTFLAEVASPATATEPVSFVQARVELLDETGELLYSTSQIPTTYNGGFTYLAVPSQGRYKDHEGQYVYGDNDLFPGGKAYLNWYLSLSESSNSADPLYGLDINRVKGMRLALIGKQYSSLGIEPVPADLALVVGSGSVSTTEWKGVFSTPATSTVSWQIRSWAKVIFRDSAGRLLDHAYLNLGSGSSWLIGPGKSSTFTAKVPADIQGTASSAVAFPSPEVGIPLSASFRGLGQSSTSEIEAIEAAKRVRDAVISGL